LNRAVEFSTAGETAASGAIIRGLQARVFCFGEFELDEQLYELRRRGESLGVQPRVFDVVLHLIEHRDRVVSKDELLGSHWPEHVSESVLPRCIAAARRALGDDADGSRYIQTLHGRGYRFVAEVVERAESTPARVEEPGAGSVFVGRASALGELRTALDAALSGKGRLVSISGEPGIGKTRTAMELSAEVERRGATTLYGRCHETRGAPEYWPWVQVLAAAKESRAAARGFADFSELAAPSDATNPAGAQRAVEQARFLLFDRFASLLVSLAREKPIAVVLDDLHWADPTSLALLVFVAERLPSAALLLIATYRDADVAQNPALSDALGALARIAEARRIELGGLEADEVAHFVEASTGTKASLGLAEAIHERTRGNPFFVEELVRLVAAAPGTEGSASAVLTALPAGVREAIGRRVAGLSAPARRVLTIGSVIGIELGVDLLEGASELPRARMLEAIDEAVRWRFLVPLPGRPGRFAFGHVLLRDTLYEAIELSERVRLHGAIAALLERIHRDDTSECLGELAHHFFQAAAGGGASDAVRYSVAAGDRALALFAWERAVEHYAHALVACDLLVPRDEGRRAEVLLALGNAAWIAGDRARARDAFQRAAELGTSLHRAELVARAALGLGGAFDWFGTPRDDLLSSLLEAARDALGEDGPAGLRAGVLSRLASVPPHSESMASRDALSRQAVELARRSGEAAMLSRALGARYWALLGPAHIDERLAICDELSALGRTDRQPTVVALAHEYRFGCLLLRADLAGADRELEALDRLARELKRSDDAWVVAWFRAGRALSDGRFDEVERWLGEGLRTGEKARHPAAELVFGGQSLFLLRERGKFDEFAAGLSLFVGHYPWAALVARAGRAYADAELGRPDAQRTFDALAAADFADFSEDEHWLVLGCMIARAAAQLGDVRRAALLRDRLQPFADLLAVHDLLRVHVGPVGLALGVLERTLGSFAEAEQSLEGALAMSERIRSAPYIALCALELGRALAAGRDRARGQALVLRAASIAREIGAEATLRAAEADG
jgi:DNA-binding winged helix-turn-helix (wHTH) protein/tetratricopeptide (TPR) repeat protein